MIRLVMMSVANTVIFPMQDILGLGSDARMNRPATLNGNWQWRLKTSQLRPALTIRLSQMVKTFARD
jgi:4-alpha-glucanotransferase